jgi:hypothetical protein
MRDAPCKIYGHLKGLAPGAAGELAGLLPQGALRPVGDVLAVEYEGDWTDPGPFLDRAQDLLQPGGDGKVDVIDTLDWTLTRHVLAPGSRSSRTASLDQSLEKYAHE